MECVILFRNTGNDVVGFVGQDEDHPDIIRVFKNCDEAIDAIPTVPILRAFPYQVLELDEL